MLTYTGARNLYGKLTHDKSSENLDTFDTLHNEILKKIISSGDYSFKEKIDSITTVADQANYELFNDLDKLVGVYHEVSITKYVPLGEITSRKQWDQLTSSNASGDIPEWYYVFNGELLCYPTPSSDSNSIYVHYLRKHINLKNADYTTGSISDIANGDTTVTGNGTTWTSSMAGRYIEMPDRQWYEISSVTDTTTLELVKEYQGDTISSGSESYIIGECSILPEENQSLGVFECCEIYFTSINPDATKAALYKSLKKEGYAMLKKEKTAGAKLTKGSLPITNPQKYYSV